MEGFFGQTVESKVPDFLTQIGSFLGENKMAILGTLAGAMGGQGGWDNASRALQGLANGSQMDTQYRDKRTQQAALQNALKSQNLTPQQMALAAADPKGYLGKVIDNQFKTPEFKQFGDSKTGYYVPDPKSPNGVRRVVDPAAPENSLRQQYEERARILQENGLKPDSPVGQSYLLTGKVPNEDRQGVSATDKKFIMQAETEVADTQAVLDKLTRAKMLSQNAGEGAGANLGATIRSKRPEFLSGMIDPTEESSNTLELDNILSRQAIMDMSNTLKGASTDREMSTFQGLAGGSSLAKKDRERIIDEGIRTAQRAIELKRLQLDQLRGGEFYKKGGGTSNMGDRPMQQAPQGMPQQGAPAQSQGGAPQQSAPSGYKVLSVK